MPVVSFAGKSFTINTERGWQGTNPSHRPTLVPYIARCIDLRAKNVASVRWLDDNDNDITPPFQTLYRIEASLCTTGAAFVTRAQDIRSVTVLNPTTMHVEATPEAGITRFVQRVNAKQQSFSPNEIIYIHLWHPNSDIHGLAPLQVAQIDADIAAATSIFTAQFFNEGALPPFIISPAENQPISDTDLNTLREVFRKAFQGLRNMWKPVFTRRQFDIQTLQIPHIADLAMQTVDDIALRRIATAFGVPVTMITDAANYATAREHNISFWRDTVFPQVKLIADAFARAFNITIYPDFDSVDALADLELTKRESIVKLFTTGIIDRQEARIYLGFEQKPQPERNLASWQDELAKWRRKSDARNVKCADFDSNILPAGVLDAVRSLADLNANPFAFARYLNVSKSAQPPFDADTDNFTRVIARVLSEQGENALNLSDRELANALNAALTPYLAQQATDAAVANMLATAEFADVERIYDLATRWAQQHAPTVASQVSATTRNAVRKILADAIANNLPNEQIAQLVAPYFSRSRAQTIAITETTRAYSQGVNIAHQILQSYGVKAKLVWNTANDELTCPICAPRHRHQRFKGWTDFPPAHPNCRCWVTIEL